MQGKTIFVTGGNSGIGLATAMLFAEHGANVSIIGRRDDRNRSAKALIESTGAQCLTFTGDVSDDADLGAAIDATCDHFGGLQYAFNNAGVEQLPAPMDQATEADYYRITDVNIKGVWLAMKREIPRIIAAGGGCIVNTSSIGGHIGMPHFPLYAASKHAVLGLTKAIALEYARANVRINAISPGYTNDTGMSDKVLAANPGVVAAVAQTIPMGRFGTPPEMAKAVLYLCRDATWTTGQSLIIDGGITVP